MARVWALIGAYWVFVAFGVLMVVVMCLALNGKR